MNATTEANPIRTDSIEDCTVVKECRLLPKNSNFFNKLILTLTQRFAEYKIAY